MRNRSIKPPLVKYLKRLTNPKLFFYTIRMDFGMESRLQCLISLKDWNREMRISLGHLQWSVGENEIRQLGKEGAIKQNGPAVAIPWPLGWVEEDRRVELNDLLQLRWVLQWSFKEEFVKKLVYCWLNCIYKISLFLVELYL